MNSKPQPRASVGSGVLQFMDLDKDIEQARRRIAAMGSVPRRQLMQGPIMEEDEEEQPKRPALAHSAKKPRMSMLIETPTLFSHPMATSHNEPSTPPQTEKDSIAELGMNSAVRLQRVLRKVEAVARRESIGEARRSLAPADFYQTSPSKPLVSSIVEESTQDIYMDVDEDYSASYKPFTMVKPESQPVEISTHDTVPTGTSQEEVSQMLQDEEMMDNSDPVPEKPRKAKPSVAKPKKTTRKVVEPEEPLPLPTAEIAVKKGKTAASVEPVDVPVKPTRRGRSVATPEPAETGVPAPITASRARRGKKAAAESSDDELSIVPAKLVKSAAKGKKTQVETASIFFFLKVLI